MYLLSVGKSSSPAQSGDQEKCPHILSYLSLRMKINLKNEKQLKALPLQHILKHSGQELCCQQ